MRPSLSMIQPTTISDDEWPPCEPGTICKQANVENHSMFAVEPSLNRRSALIKLSGLCGFGVAGATLLALRWVDNGMAEILPAEIGCIHVHHHLIAFVSNQINDRDLQTRIAWHLNCCSSCKRSYQKLNSNRTSVCKS